MLAGLPLALKAMASTEAPTRLFTMKSKTSVQQAFFGPTGEPQVVYPDGARVILPYKYRTRSSISGVWRKLP